MIKKSIAEKDNSTEEKIKTAAHIVFTKKGFAATRTRDIAEEAGLNLALLNYYFRSKENLFDIIMKENMQRFLKGISGVLNDKAITLPGKLSIIAENYINMLERNPDLPLFILSEIKANPEKLVVEMNFKEIIIQSDFYGQLREALGNKINPFHMIMNILSITIFPFAASPILKIVGELQQSDFNALMEERKQMIPLWIEAMLKAH
jgi:AcrR family transcriptional regulator